jgi:molybdate transport system substrate-binding protein
MTRKLAAGLIGITAVLGLLWWSLGPITPQHNTAPGPDTNPTAPGEPLLVYCAASNRAVVEAIRQDYEAETGRSVTFQYGASQTLLSSLLVSETGDLYLPADESYLDRAQVKAAVVERIPLARMRAVLVVRRDFPTPPASWEELLQGTLRLIQADPDAAAIGQLTRAALRPTGQWDALALRTEAYKTNVNEVANDVQLGAADAGIVYDALLSSYPQLRGIELPELNAIVAHVGVGVLTCSKQPTAALHFARYLAAIDRGAKRYRELGFTPVEGDVWADRPTLRISRLPSIPPELTAFLSSFAAREGIATEFVDPAAERDLILQNEELRPLPPVGSRAQLAARLATRLRAVTPAPILYQSDGPPPSADRP